MQKKKNSVMQRSGLKLTCRNPRQFKIIVPIATVTHLGTWLDKSASIYV